MSKVNRGKQFEEQMEKAFRAVPNTSVLRLIDPQAGYVGVHNICDYVVYRYPHIFYIECKSCYGNTLSINSNDPKKAYGAISNGQWEGLLEQSQIVGVNAGYMIWFIDHNKTYYVSARYLNKLKHSGAKSLNINNIDVDSIDVFEIQGHKKRVLFEYDINSFLDLI